MNAEITSSDTGMQNGRSESKLKSTAAIIEESKSEAYAVGFVSSMCW